MVVVPASGKTVNAFLSVTEPYTHTHTHTHTHTNTHTHTHKLR